MSIRSTPMVAAAVATLGLSSRTLAHASKLRKVSLLSIAVIVMFAGIAAWASSSHSAVKIAPPQIDPLSLMANAKNLPSQETLNLKMWPDNGVVRY
jgi:sulfite exporter TauE/SafE